MPRTAPPAVSTPTDSNGHTSPVKPLMEKLDGLRDNLKDIVRELGDVSDLLKQVEKENKTTTREVEAVREKLRKIQNVAI